MATLLVLAALPEFLQTPLQVSHSCIPYSDLSLPEGPLNEVCGIVMAGHSVVQVDLLEQLPNLEIISVFGVGYDGVPLNYCRDRGIRVTNTPDVLTDDVADIAVALVLMTSRRLVEANRFLQNGEWVHGAFPLAHAVRGKVAGILGLGRIGKAIAHRLAAHGMKIAYSGRQPQPVDHAFHANAMELARASEFLVVACPGGEGTRNLVNDAVLQALGPAGTLINIARGSVVDEAALIRNLRCGAIRAAGLDVFAQEPHVPGELAALPNVVLLPHVGSGTHETRRGMAQLCIDNLTAHFAGRPLLTPVV